MNKHYTKTIDGHLRHAYVGKGHIVTSDGLVVINPTEEILIADGWQEYVAPAPSPAELLERAKQAKLAALEVYDKTSCGEVNVFYVNDQPMWMEKLERNQTEFTIRQVEAAGGTEIPYKGFVFPVSLAKQLMAALEVYSLQAFTVTEAHKSAINALETVEAVEAYDYTVGYPEKLHFNLND